VIILISAVALFFAFREDAIIEMGGRQGENPEAFFNSCIKDKIEESTRVISLHGGYIDNPLHKEFKFEGEDFVNISYLCYTQSNYATCINQKPLFTQDLKKEIKNYISSDVGNCFNEMEESFSNEYVVDLDYIDNDFDVNILPKRVLIQTDSRMTLTKSLDSAEYKDFEVTVSSRLYEISNLVQEIVNQEAEFCYAEVLAISLTYPEFIINKLTNEESIIYSIEHEDSNEKFRFALRTCVIPPALGL
ncbi:hypothetical protein LCGC14_2561150, partial [marine sediment metagenome]